MEWAWRELRRSHQVRVGDLSEGPSPNIARILRFEHLMRRIRSARRAVSWAELAAECGYADQAHLAREVHALSGITPSGLLRETILQDDIGAPT